MDLEGFRAWIVAKGEELPIHKVELSADGKTSTCWIASEAGVEFSVDWKDTLPARLTDIVGEVYVDGLGCCTVTISSSKSLRQASVSTFIVSAYTSRNFVFSVMELTDDDAYLNKSRENKLGDITLILHRTYPKGGDREPLLSIHDPPEDTRVHERSKKGLSHCVAFGEPVRSSRPFMKPHYQPIDKGPLATFTFKYRSLDLLRANGIVPIPAPRPSLAINPSGSDTKRKRRASETPPRRVKQEKKDPIKIDPDSDSDDIQIIDRPKFFQRVKKERGPAIEKEGGSVGTKVVIDLTHL